MPVSEALGLESNTMGLRESIFFSVVWMERAKGNHEHAVKI